MRHVLIYSFLFFSTINLHAQSSGDITTLTILGRHTYSETPSGYFATILFEDDPTKCDPVRGYVPVADQIKHYKEILTANNLDTNQLHLIEKFEQAPYLNRKYKIVESDFMRLEQFLSAAKKMGLKIESVNLYYPETSLADQDDKAKLALNNAMLKANTISKHLGYRITRILNIDDDTRVASIFDDSKPRDHQRSAQLEELLAELGDLFAGGKHGYTLRVTFEITQ